ncbi:MAG: Asp23/Gls24 family envelope stress response protein [Chloroflexi bacterium]|nr:Asp23/Gls24 family envelope stress response protein [Chloroflexota bacterium]
MGAPQASPGGCPGKNRRRHREPGYLRNPQNDVNLRQVSRTIQDDVARALTEMVGMQAGQINIHIEDIDFPSND